MFWKLVVNSFSTSNSLRLQTKQQVVTTTSDSFRLHLQQYCHNKAQQSQTTHPTTCCHNKVQQTQTTHPTTQSQQGPTDSDYTPNNTLSQNKTPIFSNITVSTSNITSFLLQVVRSSQSVCWGFRSAGMWHCAMGLVVPDVSEACNAIICHIKKYRNSSSWTTESLHSFHPLAATHQMTQHHILDNLYFCLRLLQCPNIQNIISYKLTISAHLPSLGL